MAQESFMTPTEKICDPRESAHTTAVSDAAAKRVAVLLRVHDIADMLCSEHTVTITGKHRSLFTSLSKQTARLTEAISGASLNKASNSGCSFAMSADDQTLMFRHLERARDSVTRGYGSELPRLTNVGSVGEIRIFALARTLLAERTIPLDHEILIHFFDSYQQRAPLSLRELWVFPEMLRLASIGLLAEITDVSGFQLKHVGTAKRGLGALRLIDQVDWAKVVDRMSLAFSGEESLRLDPSGHYIRMNLATRDQYRTSISVIAKRVSKPNTDVAAQALRFAAAEMLRNGPEHVGAHIGFYIIGGGRYRLEMSLISSARVALRMRLFVPIILRESFKLTAFRIYSVAIIVLTLLLTWAILTCEYGGNFPGTLSYTVAALVLFATNQLSIDIIGALVTRVIKPRLLPRMDFVGGVPTRCRTLVVVPAMLISAESTERLFQALESRFLGNCDPMIAFCLLTDFADAPSENMPTDGALLEYAICLTQELNQKYAHTHGAPFLLLHRPRRWNSRDQIWMGYERKRGKIIELNALLRGAADQFFTCIVGNHAALTKVRYVITLDSDTVLPPGAAKLMIGNMSHPLNQPRYCADAGRVVAGYGILQPRLAVSRPTGPASYYQTFGYGDPEMFPPGLAHADLYQDLFEEGTFFGKGIYDVDAFSAAVHGRFPENRILSHDLIEGCYARSGMINDVETPEEFPPNYHADVRRRHRWMRGDTQIVEWIFPRVPAGANESSSTLTCREKNVLPLLARWKIAGNVRRIALPSALTLLLLVAWFHLALSSVWTALVIFVLVWPLVPSLIGEQQSIFRDEYALQSKWRRSRQSIWRHFLRSVLALAFLPFDSMLGVDAIVRSTWRISVSRKLLLEWIPSSEVNREARNNLGCYIRLMWFGPVIACAATVGLLVFRPFAFSSAFPILAMWLGSPLIAWFISRSACRRR
jgi:hypothetical protein